MEKLQVRYDDLTQFMTTCERTAADLCHGVSSHPQQLLGTVAFPHSGREAGRELMEREQAARDAMVDARERLLALSRSTRRALDALKGQDEFNADALDRIITASASEAA